MCGVGGNGQKMIKKRKLSKREEAKKFYVRDLLRGAAPGRPLTLLEDVFQELMRQEDAEFSEYKLALTFPL